MIVTERIVERFTGCIWRRGRKRDLLTMQVSDVARFRDREAERSFPFDCKPEHESCCASVWRSGVTGVARGQSGVAWWSFSTRGRESKASRVHALGNQTHLESLQLMLQGIGAGSCLWDSSSAERLGDLARLTWRAVNLETGRDRVDRALHGAPFGPRLVMRSADYLASLPASDDPNAFIFPSRSEDDATSTLLQSVPANSRFRLDLQSRAKKRGEAKTFTFARDRANFPSTACGTGRVTMLKASGLSHVFAREIVGYCRARQSRGKYRPRDI